MPFIRNTSDRRAALAAIKDKMASAMLAREANDVGAYIDHLVDAWLALMDFECSLGKPDNPEWRTILERRRKYQDTSLLPTFDDDAQSLLRRIECNENLMRLGFELEMINCISDDKTSPFYQV